MGKVGKRREAARRKASCLGKQKHKSMLSAQYVFDRMEASRDLDRSRPLEIYTCQFCGSIHIGRRSVADSHNDKQKNK